MINNYLELIDIKNIEYTEEYDNMVDITIDIDESFTLSNGIISHNSAKSSAKSGLSVVGNDYYGIYPLKGKPLNVRDVTIQKMRENDEISEIITILGLEFGKKYTSTRTLRYGKVIIMTDADCIEENTKIKTKRGNISLKDITYNDEILTHTGEYKYIKNIIESEKNEFVEFTVNGNRLKFGLTHKLLVFREGEIKEIIAKDLLKTDFLLIQK